MKFDKTQQGYAELIELLFFAYRDFTAEPDSELLAYGFGRAHHRTLHFVSRNPGLMVAELLDILRVTKQSLNRVLKQLIEEEFIYQKQGDGDKRRRHLYLTAKGQKLADKLVEIQLERISTSMKALSADAYRNVCEGLFSLIDEGDQKDVLARFKTARARK
ncbi:MAG: MarR family transcriptional regulator [Rhizobiales bacterium]|nr:MarR family transcriptional regulator [Hyphomicrobiales bacterium]NRB14061.1 MarR family transcriptional regulator [Hyphomicrobiales bacterium]